MKHLTLICSVLAAILLISSISSLRRKKFKTKSNGLCIPSENIEANDKIGDYLKGDSCKDALEVKFEDLFKWENSASAYKCIEHKEHMLTKESLEGEKLKAGTLEFVKNATPKNRFQAVYSVKEGLLYPDEKKYLNSATFRGSIDGSVYNNADIGKFIVATNAPLSEDYHEYFFKNKDEAKLKTLFEKYKFQANCQFKDLRLNTEDQNADCYSRTPVEDKDKKENTIPSFYKALEDQKIDYVVMLTNFYDEKGNKECKCIVKADKYFPFGKDDEDGYFKIDGDHRVKLENENGITELKVMQENLDIKKLKILKKEDEKDVEKHTFTHIHYRGWGDGGSAGMSEFQKLVEFLNDKYKAGERILVHCTGGVGRTGTLISSILAYGLGLNEDGTTKTGEFSLGKLVLSLRRMRPFFVESAAQLDMIRHSLFKFKSVPKTGTSGPQDEHSGGAQSQKKKRKF